MQASYWLLYLCPAIVISVIDTVLSRKYEFEADEFALRTFTNHEY
jgi:Zn-dependent protease with chaperone function